MHLSGLLVAVTILIALSFDGARVNVCACLPLAPYPASIAVQADGKRATVASLWSRRLQVVDLTPLSAACAREGSVPWWASASLSR